MTPQAALESLRDTAGSGRADERANKRLADVHAMLGADMARVEAELSRWTRAGLSPATDSAAHLLEAGGKRRAAARAALGRRRASDRSARRRASSQWSRNSYTSRRCSTTT